MRYLLLILLCFWGTCLMAQTPTDWSDLDNVRFVRGLDLRTGYLLDRPRFSKTIKNLKDQQIAISGYILPLDIEGNTYVLSRYPYAACFFCGGAGLESVMDIWFKQLNKRISTSALINM